MDIYSYQMDIYKAIVRGQIDAVVSIIKLNVKNECAPDSLGKMPIHYATLFGYKDLVELIIDTDSNMIDIRDNDGQTPLHHAVISKHESIVKLLVEKGSRLLFDKHGMTSLQHAAVLGYTDMVKQLIKLGSESVDTANKYGDTPLMMTIGRYSTDINHISLLVALSSDLGRHTYLEYCQKHEIAPVIMTEESICDVRYEVYFADSLVHLLLNMLV
jgi:hypothetical protein